MNREELSPLWCANDAPHQPHEESNLYGDWNYCTGRPEQAHTPTEAHAKPVDTSPERSKIGADSSHVTPTRAIRECTICGEKVTESNATEAWEKRHEHVTPTDDEHEARYDGRLRCADCGGLMGLEGRGGESERWVHLEARRPGGENRG